VAERIEVPIPHVLYGPRGVPEMLADADYLDHAARNLAGGYEVGGYNVTATVIKLLHDTATALRAAHGSDEPHEHICAVVGDHAVCRCLCGVTKPKGGAWPQSGDPS
jgi:hypothetical protein